MCLILGQPADTERWQKGSSGLGGVELFGVLRFTSMGEGGTLLGGWPGSVADGSGGTYTALSCVSFCLQGCWV